MKLEEKGNVIYSFSAEHKPVAEVAPGEILVVETADCFNGQIHGEERTLEHIDMERVNPATGPFYISGAQPGDALEVEILEIKTSDKGILVTAPELGVLGKEIDKPKTSIVKLTESNVVLSQDISLPIQPMLGVIGVAPRDGQASCGSAGDHGGNLDTREVRAGSKVILPVYHPGGLLALGDVHALMGDGQISGSGIETAAEVKLRVEVLKNPPVSVPLVKTQDGTYVIKSSENLELAIQQATRAGVKVIQEQTGLPFADAYTLAGVACQLRFSQVVNPMFTVKLFVPNLLKTLQE